MITPNTSVDEAITMVGTGPTQWLLLLLCGVTFMADATEVTFLSLASEQLKCELDLSEREESTIASTVFVGIGVGAVCLGPLSDMKGRRLAFLLSTAMLAGFGILTAVSQSFWQLLLFRFFTGFGVAGGTIAFDILSEACDVNTRGLYTMILNYLWTVGCLYVNSCAWFFMHSYGWRGLAVLAAIPPFITLVLAIWLMPESPRWLVCQNRMDEAVDTVNYWANKNGVEGRPITALKDEMKEADAGCMEVLKDRSVRKDYWLMSIIWPCKSLAFYGILLLIPRLFEKQKLQTHECKVEFEFKSLVFSCTAEALGVLWASLAVNCAGRKCVQSLGYAMCGVAGLFLMSTQLSWGMLTFITALGRNGIMAASCCTWVHTPELFPTRFRSTAHASLNAASRIGAFIAPFLIQKDVSSLKRSLILAAVSFVASGAALCLTETAGKAIGKANASDSEESMDYEDGSSSDGSN